MRATGESALMSTQGPDSAFTGSIPDTYERYLVPLLFVPYARDIARRTMQVGGNRVLEIAAGTGVVTRELSSALPSAIVDATDLNAAMVEAAAGLCARPNVSWSVADAAGLPFDDNVFDVAICQFGVMFFPDRVAAFREARRVLRDGGTFLFNVWDGLERNDVARVVSEQAARVFPNDPPLFLQRTPYGQGDAAAISRDLHEAGFTSVACDVVTETSRAPSARDAATGFCAGTPLYQEIVRRRHDGVEDVINAAATALARTFGDGPIAATMQAMVFTAR
jgi:ubiquinone/menaquinone biosynthesis C-methylase UbiE